MNQPAGTIITLFTDIEDSTRLWEQHPGVMEKALKSHDTILREAIESKGGSTIKTTGDGAHAVFAGANDAVGAAIAAQKELIALSITV